MSLAVPKRCALVPSVPGLFMFCPKAAPPFPHPIPNLQNINIEKGTDETTPRRVASTPLEQPHLETPQKATKTATRKHGLHTILLSGPHDAPHRPLVLPAGASALDLRPDQV